MVARRDDARALNARYILIRPITTWPAVIFAANRKLKVMGRRLMLVISTRFRKGFSHEGAPPGSKAARKL